MMSSEIALPSNRKFGGFFSVVFALPGIYFLVQGAQAFALIFFVLSALLFMVTLLRSQWLLPFNKLWMRFGLLLGAVVNPIVLGIIYFGVFTPMGLVMKLFGRDELRLKPSDQLSYWKIRDLDDARSDPFKFQF